MKKILGLHASPRPHWVGDGFPVRSLFSYNDRDKATSPFLLLDYAGPAHFEPAGRPRGVGQHPHRGFETVTIVYSGEVEHRDSAGNGGVIGPGDVQWMTAASGIVHEEFHSDAFTRQGGELEMVQLWVNLPAKDKMGPAGYQGILAADIPSVDLPDGAGTLRVIAGSYAGHAGPARTHTPMDVWDVRLAAGKSARFPIASGRNSMLVALRGTLLVNGESVARDAQLALFSRDGEDITVEANNDAVFLVLSGEPIDEPVVGYGPFVMNTQAEIVQAFADFR
jgi:hypothetical protein